MKCSTSDTTHIHRHLQSPVRMEKGHLIYSTHVQSEKRFPPDPMKSRATTRFSTSSQWKTRAAASWWWSANRRGDSTKQGGCFQETRFFGDQGEACGLWVCPWVEEGSVNGRVLGSFLIPSSFALRQNLQHCSAAEIYEPSSKIYWWKSWSELPG